MYYPRSYNLRAAKIKILSKKRATNKRGNTNNVAASAEITIRKWAKRNKKDI